MALYNDSNYAALENTLKNIYKQEGLSNLLQKNDAFLESLQPEYVEGKSASFAALYSRGGAVSAKYTVAKRLAIETGKTAEFVVTPGKLFSGAPFSVPDLLACKTNNGAYNPIIDTKFFYATETFRKTLASCLYHTGYGELTKMASDAADLTAGTTATIALPRSATMALDIGSEIVFKTNKSDPEVEASTVRAKVLKVSAYSVDVNPVVGGTIANKWLCIAGGTSDEGKPLFPVGIPAWISAEEISANDSFFGQNRSKARDRLAGTAITKDSSESLVDVIERAILLTAANNSACDVIIMNDEDRLALAKELSAKTYFQKVDGGKGKSKGEVGYNKIGFSVNENYLDKIYSSAYMPKGTVYVGDLSTIKMWVYTNTEVVRNYNKDENGNNMIINGGNGGEVAKEPYQLLIDNLITVQPGTDTDDGAGAFAALNFFGQFVITHPSAWCVITL